MKIYHNSQDLNYRKPFGALEVGVPVTISVDVADIPLEIRSHEQNTEESTDPSKGKEEAAYDAKDCAMEDETSLTGSEADGLSEEKSGSGEKTEVSGCEEQTADPDSEKAGSAGGSEEDDNDISVRPEDLLSEDDPVKVYIVTEFDGTETSLRMIPDESGERFSVSFYSGVAGLLWYYFRVEIGTDITYYGNNLQRLGGEGHSYAAEPYPYQITVHWPDKSPEWFKNAIVYQIFPDRFNRGSKWRQMQFKAEDAYELQSDQVSDEALLKTRPKREVIEDWNEQPHYLRNEKGEVIQWNFFGGNLNGITEKLDYLEDLGITCIYLNPVFKAASNHKYDTSDYEGIDEAFGDIPDFRTLCEEAQKHGISIILDGVFNHTGADSRYFNLFGRFKEKGAAQGEESEWYEWYTFENGGYDCWWDVRDLPNVRELTESYRRFIYEDKHSIVRRWLRAGAKGWRLDVADELPDEFIKGIRAAMTEEDPDSLLMGEVWEDASNKVSYGVLREYYWGKELHSTMHYPFREAALGFMKGRINASEFCRILLSIKENYPRENYYANLNLIDSHDRSRALTELADGPEYLSERLELSYINPHCYITAQEAELVKKGVGRSDAIKACYTIPEESMWMARNRLKDITLLQFTVPGVPCIYYGDEAGMQGMNDPYNRGTFPWKNIDEELHEHYRMLCALRKEHPVLVNGDFFPYALSDHVVCFERRPFDGNSGEVIRVIVNRGIFEWENVSLDAGCDVLADILTNEEYTGCEGRFEFTLAPLEAKVLIREGV